MFSSKISWVFILLFGGLGLIFLLILGGTTISEFVIYNNLKENGTIATAVITSIEQDDETHTVYISYKTKEGEIVNTTHNIYSSSMHEGGTFDVYYDSSNPYKYTTVSGIDILFPLLFMLLPLVFIGVAGVILVYRIRYLEMVKRLKKTGTWVWATITGIGVDHSVQVNGVSQQVLECQYNKFFFRSGFIKNVNFYSQYSEVAVSYNPDNPDEYFVDLKQVR